MATEQYDPAFLVQQFPSCTSFTYIAVGGQKVVYSATHSRFGKVALKIFSPGADRQRVTREIDATRQIPTTHVPEIFESGLLQTQHGEALWIIEQWVDGRSLRQCLAEGSVSDGLTMIIARDVLSVLVEAEKLSIVHRDIKPENILISADYAKAWLIDFGIARFTERTALTSGVFGVFTPGYAPPEQIHNNQTEIDTRSDLFSLGITLYECVEKTNPIAEAAGGDCARMVAISETQQPPLLSRHIDNALQFSDLVHSMTRVKRNHRIASASEAFQWINEIIDH